MIVSWRVNLTNDASSSALNCHYRLKPFLVKFVLTQAPHHKASVANTKQLRKANCWSAHQELSHISYAVPCSSLCCCRRIRIFAWWQREWCKSKDIIQINGLRWAGARERGREKERERDSAADNCCRKQTSNERLLPVFVLLSRGLIYSHLSFLFPPRLLIYIHSFFHAVAAL